MIVHSIKTPSPHEADQISRLFFRVTQEQDYLRVEVPNTTQVCQYLQRPMAHASVLFDAQNAVQGFLFSRPVHDFGAGSAAKRYASNRDSMWLSWLMVAPAYRRSGAAQEMMDRFFQAAHNMRAPSAGAMVAVDNAGSLGLFAKNGFSECMRFGGAGFADQTIQEKML